MAPDSPTPEWIVEQTSELVTLPEVYFKVKRVLEDPDTGLRDLAAAIETDPGLTARLLRIANSALFGFVAQIDTANRAVTLLGPQQVHDLVLATSVNQSFARLDGSLVDLRQHWRQSLFAGVLSRQLGAECNVLDGERLFVEGLLHAVGHLLMLQVIPDPCARALVESRRQQRPLASLERELLGFDYSTVGGELLRQWQLPASIVATVRHHCRPQDAEDFHLEVNIVHIADRIAPLLDQGADVSSWAPHVHPQAWQFTGLNEEKVQPLIGDAAEVTQRAIDLIFAV